MLWFLVLALILAVVAIIAAVYLCPASVFVLRFTNNWYGAMVQNIEKNSRLLDIGSGIIGVHRYCPEWIGLRFSILTGLVSTVLAKELKVVAIEGDEDNFKKVATTLVRAGLRHSVVVHNKSISDSGLPQLFVGDARFDTIVFSSPLMSHPDPAAALRKARSLLKPEGVIYIPQVYDHSPAVFLPLFKLLRIASIADVKKVVEEVDMEVFDDLPAVGSDASDKKNRAARVLVVQRVGRTTTSSAKQRTAAKDGEVRSRKGIDSEL